MRDHKQSPSQKTFELFVCISLRILGSSVYQGDVLSVVWVFRLWRLPRLDLQYPLAFFVASGHSVVVEDMAHTFARQKPVCILFLLSQPD